VNNRGLQHFGGGGARPRTNTWLALQKKPSKNPEVKGARAQNLSNLGFSGKKSGLWEARKMDLLDGKWTSPVCQPAGADEVGPTDVGGGDHRIRAKGLTNKV